MNKIRALLDENFVRELLKKELLPHYPEFTDIGRVEITPYKKLIWETTYHVVIGFKVFLRKATGEEVVWPVVCSAHSEEERERVFTVLNYLWAREFPDEQFNLPRPLFYSTHFRGVFYLGLEGENLLYYIKKMKRLEIRKIVKAAAELFARLHALPVGPEANFNPINARIATVVPGTAVIFKEVGARYHNKYNEDLIKIYNYFIATEERFFNSAAPQVLIHGDAHAENIIKTGADKIGLIDFTDCCLGDPARDLGTFLQQLEYKIITKTGRRLFAARMKRIFLRNYLRAAHQRLTAELRARIDLYYNWTMARTAIFWFLKFGHSEADGAELLATVKKNLKI